MAKKKIEKGFDKALYTYNQLDNELKRLPPNDLYINSIEFEKELSEFTGFEFGNETYFSKESVFFHQSPQPAFNKKFDLLAQNLKENSQENYQNYIFSDTFISTSLITNLSSSSFFFALKSPPALI